MKKLLLFLLSLTFTAATLSGCNFFLIEDESSSVSVETSSDEASNEGESSENNDSSIDEKTVYSVTFKQEGQNDIVKEVEEGKALTDIPTPTQKIGYTVKWTVEDFSNVTENMTVEVVSTANEYTITYDANGGTVTPETQKVTYDAIPQTFATPTSETHNFVCWTYEGKAVQATDIWKFASDVTLVASWVEKEKRTVSFVQDGYETIVIEVLDGASLPGELIPDTQPKKGYTVVWEEKLVPSITENIVINAVATPNNYTITYDAGEGTVTPATQAVTYDVAPQSFATPTREGFKFKGWEYEGKVISANDLWTIDKDVTLTAKWAKTYTITLNANGGTLSETTIVVVEGEAYTLPTPTQEEHHFKGWKYGLQTIAVNGVWTIEGENIKLVAEWEEFGWTGNY